MPRVREGTSDAMAEGCGNNGIGTALAPVVTEEQQFIEVLEDGGHRALEHHLSQADGTRQAEVSG